MAEEADGEGQEQGEEEEYDENRFGGGQRFDAEADIIGYTIRPAPKLSPMRA